jgi:hypothetical protein
LPPYRPLLLKGPTAVKTTLVGKGRENGVRWKGKGRENRVRGKEGKQQQQRCWGSES